MAEEFYKIKKKISNFILYGCGNDYEYSQKTPCGFEGCKGCNKKCEVGHLWQDWWWYFQNFEEMTKKMPQLETKNQEQHEDICRSLGLWSMVYDLLGLPKNATHFEALAKIKELTEKDGK